MSNSINISYKGSSKNASFPVQANTTMKSLVQDFCQKFELGSPRDFVLKYNNSEIPQSQAGMQGLPRNATLTLERSKLPQGPSNVTVALSIPQGERVIKDFSSDTSLWAILKKIEEDSGSLNLTERQESSGSGGFMGIKSSKNKSAESLLPVLLISGLEYGKKGELGEVTLESIGIYTGKIPMRLSFAGSESLGTSKPQLPKENNAVVAKSQAKSIEAAVNQSPSQNQESNAASDPQALSPTEAPEPFSRNVRVFDAPKSSSVPSSARFELPDSFYDITPAELKSIISHQNQQRKKEESQGFKTRETREQEKKEKLQQTLNKYPKTCIRFRFSDGIHVQALFMTHEKVSMLFGFVESVLKAPEDLSTLFIAPPKESLEKSKNVRLVEKHLFPATIVHVQLTSKSGGKDAILPEYLAKLEPFQSGTSAAQKQCDGHQPASSSGRPDDKRAKPSTSDQKSKKMSKLLSKLFKI
ncbi:hypothetical protein H4219_000241 [Mycoemilia scoparia]|uniref:TUG ubiquitin-like domain-containing protein n=1 Tax=Mycoemilia scoparia TaxID=417184 RepID=A0A9W8DXF4_9FUNG|nr:hypothetical protein H4219_000241 [Mycoemilia scoparia]